MHQSILHETTNTVYVCTFACCTHINRLRICCCFALLFLFVRSGKRMLLFVQYQYQDVVYLIIAFTYTVSIQLQLSAVKTWCVVEWCGFGGRWLFGNDGSGTFSTKWARKHPTSNDTVVDLMILNMLCRYVGFNTVRNTQIPWVTIFAEISAAQVSSLRAGIIGKVPCGTACRRSRDSLHSGRVCRLHWWIWLLWLGTKMIEFIHHHMMSLKRHVLRICILDYTRIY